ncbi:MAG: hypothetical protein PHX21_13020 [bacterium]|nr:hypothetical protein [bacterium]
MKEPKKIKQTLKLAKKLQKELKRNGINTLLFGSIVTKGVSTHDIDLVLLRNKYGYAHSPLDGKFRSKMDKMLNPKMWCETDNGSLFLFETEKYGNVDFFPISFLQKKCWIGEIIK